MITRRDLIAGAVALASGCADTASAAETGPRMVRLTWTGGSADRVDYQEVPATAMPWVGRFDFGGGVVCMVEEVTP